MSPVESRSWSEHPDLVEFFSSNRSTPDSLYPSERRFLPWLAERSGSVLDIGCAAGGFADVWRAYNPAIAYAGADLSQSLIDTARKLRPKLRFLVGDSVAGIDLPDAAAETVAALGWLHWEPRWREALPELWRLAGQYLFFDMRLTPGTEDLSGEQRLDYRGEWDRRTATPYVCASWPAFARLLAGLGPTRILGHGYMGSPANTVEGIGGDICFATFVLERGETGGAAPEICLDLPLEWPNAGAQVIPGVELDRLVPPPENPNPRS